MSDAPTWDRFREMLDALAKTSEQLHEQLHPLYERVGEHKNELGSPVQDWSQIEPAWLELVETMRFIITAHLQQNTRC